MKRLGVQIAAGAVTVLLGVLAAAHAQKDRNDAPETDWKSGDAAELRQAPKPIEDVRDSWASGPDDDGQPSDGDPLAGGDPVARVASTVEPESPPIRLVQHTDSFDSQGAFDSEQSTRPSADQAETDDHAGDPDTFGDAPSFGMPPSLAFDAPETEGPESESPDAAQARESPRSSAGDDTTSDETPMPAMAFGQPPSMSFPGFGDDESDATNEPRETPESREAFDSNGSTPSNVAGGTDDPGFNTPPINGLREPAGPSDDAYGEAAATNHGTSMTNDIRPEPEPDQTQGNEFGSWGGQFPAPPPVADQPPQEASIGMSETAPPRLASLPQSSPQRSPDAASKFAAGSQQMLPIDPSAHARTNGLARDGGEFGGGLTTQRMNEREGFQADPRDGEPRTLDSPGDRRLEGAQTPSLVIQKRAPREVKVGKPASFVISIRNVGSAEAIDVRLHDRVPVGMRLANASPSPVRQGEELVWHLGALPAGDERTVTMQLVPEQEGELGSVARVSFEAAASVRTVSTRPELKIVQRAPEAVLIGQQLEIELEVSNPGTGEAVGVVLQADVPDGLEHPKGSQLDNLLGNLQPGEVRREVLRLRAVAPGQIRNVVRLVSDDGLTAEHAVNVAVIAPQLQVGLNGPTRRYVERQATYEVQITNAGTAEASNVEIAAFLDRGFTFVSTENQGQYDPNRHAVFWSLARLPEGAAATVPLTLLPVEVGEQAIRVEANADLGAEGRHEQTVAVDSLAELTFQLSDTSDPIEMGAETAYEIRVTNSGSRDDANVRVELELPAGLELLSSDVDAEQDDRGRVYFEPRGRLDAGGELTYRVKVRGVAPGRHITKATVTSDQSGVAVTKEESTMVYADR